MASKYCFEGLHFEVKYFVFLTSALQTRVFCFVTEDLLNMIAKAFSKQVVHFLSLCYVQVLHGV